MQVDVDMHSSLAWSSINREAGARSAERALQCATSGSFLDFKPSALAVSFTLVCSSQPS